MAVKIRLSRIGKKHRPFWRIVAVDARKKRDGEFLDNIGTYDGVNKKLVSFRPQLVEKWIAVGAQCTPTVVRILKSERNNPTISAVIAE
jgi:small subunit ribosomal protein S16